MTSDRPSLTHEEEAFVRKLAGAYVAPELSPPERAAFHAGLERRITRRRTAVLWRPVFAGTAVAVALAVIVFARAGTVAPPSAQTPAATNGVAASTTAENVILALATESADEREVELPDDYLAIAGVFLGD
jgi:hypothetical protein